MTLPPALTGPSLWAELEDDSLQVSNGTAVESIPLKRRSDGRLEAASRQSLMDRLQILAPRAPWQTRGTLWCALPARGVSLRRVSIPPTRPEDLRRVLGLQVESRFPLPPDQLAWGAYQAESTSVSPSSSNPLVDWSVAALRAEAIEELSQAFIQSGFHPVFTLASLVRQPSCRPSTGRTVLLHLGDRATEWISFEGALPELTRSVAWGESTLLHEISKSLGVDVSEASQRARAWAVLPPSDTPSDPGLESAVLAAASPFLDSLRPLPAISASSEESWWLSGSELLGLIAAKALRARRPGVRLISSADPSTPADPTAIAGLRTLTPPAANGNPPIPLRLELPQAKTSLSVAGMPAIPWPWVARAGALVLALLLFPYFEAVLGRPLLQRRLAALQKDRARLSEIDRRLDFVDLLAGSQPPYVEALYVIANAAPQGAKVDSVSMNRRGELSLSGYTQMPQQAVDFRTRLVDSKYFSSVVLEEQAPVQGGPQRVNLRITAQWKGPAEREALQLGPALPDPAKTNTPAGRTNAPSSPPAPRA